jgi:hypothetical protein
MSSHDKNDAGWRKLVYQSSLVILPAEISGREWKEWTKE